MFLKALLVIIPFSLLTAGLAAWRAKRFVTADVAAERGMQNVRKTLFFNWLGISVVFGVVAYFVHAWMATRYGAKTDALFLELAIALGLIFSTMAFALKRALRIRPLVEYLLIHILWVIGFGWLLPLVIR